MNCYNIYSRDHEMKEVERLDIQVRELEHMIQQLIEREDRTIPVDVK